MPADWSVVDPKTVRREAEPDNPEIRQCMREIAATRRRFGYPPANRQLRSKCREAAHRHHARTGGHRDEPQEAETSLQGGRTGGETQTWPQARHWNARTEASARRSFEALEPRLRIGRVRTRTAVRDVERDRRLHQRMPGADRRHLTVRCTRGL